MIPNTPLPKGIDERLNALYAPEDGAHGAVYVLECRDADARTAELEPRIEEPRFLKRGYTSWSTTYSMKRAPSSATPVVATPNAKLTDSAVISCKPDMPDVHEYVHYLQHRSGRFATHECKVFVKREREAYAVQPKFFIAYGAFPQIQAHQFACNAIDTASRPGQSITAPLVTNVQRTPR